MKSENINPLSPKLNIAVSASAGAGKTYLLVNRIVRLLIEGEPAGSILAITFTRKAANEMLERVHSRLWELHLLDDQQLTKALQEEFALNLNEMKRDELLNHVRQLHHEALFAEPSLRISTFHAFCQDLLQQFALDIDLPPAFELTEQTFLLKDMAWEKLFNDITTYPQHALRPAVDELFKQLGSTTATKSALLDGFLEQRADWWSFTAKQDKPVDYAIKQAKSFFNATELDPKALFISTYQEDLLRFGEIVQHQTQKIYQQICQAISLALLEPIDNDASFARLKAGLLKQDGGPYANIKHSKTLEKQLGAQLDDMLSLYHRISSGLIEALDQIKCQKLYQLHQSWYEVGATLLEHYQSIKRQKHQLDFSDLEWLSYQLLSHADNAQWVQYKLDSRINHLLIDEFQDTNPTQWQMLLPLLEEMASGESDRLRSVFLVGDTKQSIYGFRRANPELQNTAVQWLEEHLNAKQQPLNKSWRSSKAVMDAVNLVFSGKPLLKDFDDHDTNVELPGLVECWPLFREEENEEPTEVISFRNPLTTPLVLAKNDSHQQEANAIAEKIQSLIESKVAVGKEQKPIEYGDIYILLRKRTHAATYEQSLANLNIPYDGTESGTLLDCQEVADIICLLRFLATPFDNMALAQLLKSPIFNGNNQDLMDLARTEGNNWYQRLDNMCKLNMCSEALVDAHSKLNQWIELQHLLPVHDLLHKIYHQGDIIERYKLSVPENVKSRVKANLQYLLELALDIDSGRYPSVMRFLQHIQKLKSARSSEKPDSLREQSHTNRVKVMTIHGSKGLEAPVIFMADTYSDSKTYEAYSCHIDWPTESSKVDKFLLLPRKEDIPECIKLSLQGAEKKSRHEDNNLLYVAMTRAVNMLFITGSQNRDIRDTWYERVSQNIEAPIVHGEFQAGKPDNQTEKQLEAKQHSLGVAIAPRENTKNLVTPSLFNIHTAYKSEHSEEETHEATERGNIIHHILYCINENKPIEFPKTLLEYNIETTALNNWRSEAKALTEKPELAYLFNPSQYEQAFNEIPVLVETESEYINGIIDRLVLNQDTIYIIDYKTHSINTENILKEIADSYQLQMKKYRQSIKALYPDKNCKSMILFTFTGSCFELN